ncbi:MAG: DUF192 domain-containing protein [Candidatus ainarchaeum sp.]|nr:DUF192 domain-containing protein [Candidatus ainarchaeum sp.]
MIKVNNKIIIKKKKIISPLKQGLGLMFFPRRKFDFGLIFKREYESIVGSSIHMLFVFYPINVIFLDSNKKVVDIKKKLKPFTFYSPKKKAKYIIELPIETDISFIKINDVVSF